MKNEIERKFFVNVMPDISGIKALHYERYFINRDNGDNGIEERISKIDDEFWYQRKVEISELERTQEKKRISESEFNQLKEKASEAIIRDRYNLSFNPDIVIQIYHGRFEGLIRAEVEFNSEAEAKSFIPLSWMGEEMTGLPIARDSKLLDLTDSEFRKYLK
jgi:CYTH domain-containing protein